MKIKKLLPLSILIASLSVTGCANFFNNIVSPNVPTPTGTEPLTLQYTIEDLFDRNLYGIDCFPSVGDTKTLLIPVYFDDSDKWIGANYKDNVIEDLNTVFNGTSQETGYESVKSYYTKMSNGKLNVTATISDWYHDSNSAYYYGKESDFSNLTSLIKKATDWYFNTHEDSRKDYDYDNNGVLDGVIFIYAAPDYEQLGISSYSNFWAFTSWLQDTNNPANITKPVLNQYIWASYDFMYSMDKDAKARTGSTYGGGDTSHCKLDAHTYIHEFGHILGLEDLYDYGSKSYTPAGVFSMQDYNVGSHDPFSTIALGWTEVIVPTETVTVELKSFQDSHQVILLTNNYTGSVFDEYLLVELYTPTGLNAFDSTYSYRNKFPTGSALPGVRVWHIDARLATLSFTGGKTYYHGITTSPTSRQTGLNNPLYTWAWSNSYEGDMVSILDGIEEGNVRDYNIVQLIRDEKRSTYRPRDYLTFANLFTATETFNIETFKNQFVNGTMLNNGTEFKWTFKVNSVSLEKANITFTLEK